MDYCIKPTYDRIWEIQRTPDFVSVWILLSYLFQILQVPKICNNIIFNKNHPSIATFYIGVYLDNTWFIS